MSRLAALKAAASLSDLANLLGFRPSAVSFVLYKQAAGTKYKTFQIPKRSGGYRTIEAPVDALKLLQRRLSILLQDCLDEVNGAKTGGDRTAHGFMRRHSIITNAKQHRHRRWIFNLDLENFFPSINFGRVRGFLIKNREFQLHERVATVIAQIACNGDWLPQGSPCSPVISNLVAHILDIRLAKLASEAGCTYSRYADDLTFSTNKKAFPASIAIRVGADSPDRHLWAPAEALREVIERSGFRINSHKSHLMYRASRQTVTGLVVNEKINIRWEYRHNVRAMVHSLVKTGGFELVGAVAKDGATVLEKRPGTLRELQGMLGFIDSIERYNRAHAPTRVAGERSSREKSFREFLIYGTFYAATMPVVICEGATDNVYLTHAIRSLGREFPELAEVMSDNSIKLKVRLFKYPRLSSTARLLGLGDGGSSVLSKFISMYRKETKRFTAPGLKNPVIVVYDDDQGAKSIKACVKDLGIRIPSAGAQPFVYLFKNLYLVPTPRSGGATESTIEDFFDEATRGTMIDGKTFSPTNDADSEEHYGKTIFAHRVVRERADSIDFSGFRQLLDGLAAVVRKHKATIVPEP